MAPRPAAFLLAAAGISLCASNTFAQGVLSTSAACDGDGNATVSWTFYEPFYGPPTAHPEWVGYDLYRRTVDPCGDYQRLNAAPYSRTVGATHTITDTHSLPASFTTYEYLVVMVDAQRQDIGYPQFGSDFTGYASCPSYSAPISLGPLEDLGWALILHPCVGVGTCYPGGLIEGPLVEELRPVVATGGHLYLFGDLYCGGVEGCTFAVDHWTSGYCYGLLTQTATIGRVKAFYR